MADDQDEYVSAREAADLIGVKRETLYAYVSRGMLESVPDPESSRAKLYRLADLKRLKARAAARSGEGAVAAGALQWGAPVLDTAICEMRPDGPAYRGWPLRTLVDDRVSFERVAELLWNGTLPNDVVWDPPEAPAAKYEFAQQPLDAIREEVLRIEFEDPTRVIPGSRAAIRHARRLLPTIVAALGDVERAADATFAARVATALGGEPTAEVVRAVNTALVVCAEHELNASAFAARVAASTGANVYSCLQAALGAFSGARHGGMDARIVRLLRDAAQDGVRTTLLSRLEAGAPLPGFGHPLYSGGDPRFDMLWDAAVQVRQPPGEVLAEIVAVADELAMPAPNLDLGLCAVALACDLYRGAVSTLFALGRMAGWVAHAIEQAEAGFLLRPRARYTGPAQGSGPE